MRGYLTHSILSILTQRTTSNRNSLNVVPKTSDLPTSIPCDPLFAPAWKSVRAGTEDVLEWAEAEQKKFHESGRSQRVRKERVLHNV